MSPWKVPLGGSAEDVATQLEMLSESVAQHEYLAASRLRLLAVELSQRPGLRVWLVTYEDDSQELEVTSAGDPHCDPVIMIDRDGLGENCQVTLDRWLPIRDSDDVSAAADMVANVLDTCVRLGAQDGRHVEPFPNTARRNVSQDEEKAIREVRELVKRPTRCWMR